MADGVIDFCWPSEKEISLNSESKKISKLEIWSYKEKKLWTTSYNFTGMTGVRISLSNGMQSPIFSRGDKWRSKHSVLNVNGEVRRILLKCDNPTTGIEFIDNNKKQICKWEGNIEDRGAWRC